MKKIFNFLKKLFARTKFYVEKYVHPSVEVVQALKSFIDSPAVPIITALIPGNVDDVIASQIRILLPEVLKVLGYADQCINAKGGDTIVQCALSKIRLMKDDGKEAAWHNIASLLSKYLADGKLTWREALHLAEEVFQEKYGQAA